MSLVKKLWVRVSSFFTITLISTMAMAQGHSGIAQSGDGSWIAIAIGVGLGLAALGGAIGQSRTAAAALEGIARNPNASDKIFVPMILSLAFIESLVLFTWVLMFLLQNKL